MYALPSPLSPHPSHPLSLHPLHSVFEWNILLIVLMLFQLVFCSVKWVLLNPYLDGFFLSFFTQEIGLLCIDFYYVSENMCTADHTSSQISLPRWSLSAACQMIVAWGSATTCPFMSMKGSNAMAVPACTATTLLQMNRAWTGISIIPTASPGLSTLSEELSLLTTLDWHGLLFSR